MAPKHWSEDEYWTKALDRFIETRDSGVKKLVIDLDAVQENMFEGDGPAYKTMEAMVSVHHHEGGDGCRGAPRILMALLQILSEQKKTS